MFYRYIALRMSVHLAERAKDREKIIELQVNVRQRDVEIARLRKALEDIIFLGDPENWGLNIIDAVRIARETLEGKND